MAKKVRGLTGGDTPTDLQLQANVDTDTSYCLAVMSRQVINGAVLTMGTAVAYSSALDTTGFGPRGMAIQTPAEWTAADIGFEVSSDGETYFPVRDSVGTAVRLTNVATALAAIYTAPTALWCAGSYRYFRLTSLDVSDGTAELQAAARSFTVTMLQ